MKETPSLEERCRSLSLELSQRWSVEFAETLLDHKEAALGFSVALSVEQCWATAVDGIEPLVTAAERFLVINPQAGYADED